MNYFNKISKIQIKQFRKFDNLVIDFKKDNYFVFSGKNGTGKTSILEAINIAFSERTSKYIEIEEADFYSDDPIELIVELDDYFFLSFDDHYTGYDRLVPCKKFKKIIKRRDRKENNVLFSSSYDVSLIFDPDNFNIEKSDFNQLEEQFNDVIEKRQKIVRTFTKIKEDKFEYSVKTRPDDIKTEEHMGFQYMKKILFPEIFYYDNNRKRELLSDYNTTLSNVVNEVDWRYKKQFIKNKDCIVNKYSELKESINSLDDYKKELLDPAKKIFKNDLKVDEFNEESLDFFYFNYYQPYANSIFGIQTQEKQIIPALKIGSGIANLLSLAISISFAQKNKNPIIILIDEPEIHLQANLQKNLYKFLCKNKNFQTIVSTHSHLFINKQNINNNIIIEEVDNKTYLKYCEKIDICDLQFRLLGNSVDDLIIPEKILLVEGKHDKNIVLKCLELIGKQSLQIQIIPVGGKDNMPDKSERYKVVIDEILKKGKWYSDYIVKILKIVVDGDVSDDKIDNWVREYNFDKDKQTKKINDNGIEYLFPKSLIKECVKDTILKDNTPLKNKDKNEILSIIFKDDKENDDGEYEQIDDRVSKARLNAFVLQNITKDILENEECDDLLSLIKWII